MTTLNDTEMDLMIARARITEMEQQQREDVAMIRQANESLALATEVIRRYQVVFRAARTLQERFGVCCATYDADNNPTEATEAASEAIHPAAQALWVVLDAFEIPAGKRMPLEEGTLEPHWAKCPNADDFRRKKV